ncbi:DNA polymerase III PolC-type [Ferrovum sp. JA12]|uniref:3'-5' exonuclease n=1 Tax=Ferrovum sp. JA12 TaxID=1356299 RepID=UPI000702C7CC|nr:3'-5' exonuclease [Ferrovum sp. JA12]KRH79474.1 DNA polymerase III PolC-type [Ferrovum sp. JA12]
MRFNIWQVLLNRWYKKQLKKSEYDFLLAPPPANEWVSLDCETTGLNREKDQIIAIGAIKIIGNQILTSEKLQLFIKPQGQIHFNSIKIHRIRHKDLSSAIDPINAIDQLVRFIGSRPLVGYYLEFDVAMINKLLIPMIGIPLPQQKIDVSGLFYDYKFKQHTDSNVDLHFNYILKELEIPSWPNHDAINDALMTALMFLKLRKLLKLK